MVAQHDTVPSEPFDSLLDRIRDAREWFEINHVPFLPTRFGHYEKTLDRLVKTYRTNDGSLAKSQFSEFVNTLYEIQDILLIKDGLSAQGAKGFGDKKLKEIAKGPIWYTDETTSSGNRARNIAFELVVASYLAKQGLILSSAGSVDVACMFEGKKLLFECKRPQSKRQIEKNIKVGMKQLRRHLVNLGTRRHQGIVALDLTKIVNPDFKILPASTGSEITASLRQKMDAFIKAYSGIWQKVSDKNSLGILVRITCMAIVESQGRLLTHCQEMILWPNPNIKKENKQRLRRLEDQLRAAFYRTQGE